MSLLGIARPHGRHRGQTVRELHARIEDLQTSRQVLQANMDRLASQYFQLQRQFDAAGIERSGLLLDVEEAQREIQTLRAALANATSTSSLHLHQAVTETQPVPVVVPLHLSPLAGTSPTHRRGL